MIATPRTGGRWGRRFTAVTALFLMGLIVCTAVGRVMRAPPAVLVLVVTLLPYLYALMMAWLFALWAALPDRREPPVFLVVVFTGALLLWGPSWGAQGEDAEGLRLTAMSWNVRRLWGGKVDGGDPFECVEKVVKVIKPDVLTLLEVSELDLDKLAYRLGFECVHSTYHGRGGRQVGGLAACVRGDRWTLSAGSPMRFVDAEDWYYTFAEVQGGGRVFNLLSVHLYPYEFSVGRLQKGLDELMELGSDGAQTVAAQGNQTRALLERVQKFNDPTLVAGDFNSSRDLSLHASLRASLTDTWERGGQGMGSTVDFLDYVPLRVDYVYATESFAVNSARVPDVGCSDHRPVVSELVLRAPVGPAIKSSGGTQP